MYDCCTKSIWCDLDFRHVANVVMQCILDWMKKGYPTVPPIPNALPSFLGFSLTRFDAWQAVFQLWRQYASPQLPEKKVLPGSSQKPKYLLGLLKSPNWNGGLHGRRKVYLSFLTSLHGRRLHIQPFLCLNFVVSSAGEGGFWARKVAISRKDASSNREPQPMPQAEDIGFSLTHFDAWQAVFQLWRQYASPQLPEKKVLPGSSQKPKYLLGLLKSPNWNGGLHGRRKVYLSFLTSLHGRRLHIQPFLCLNFVVSTSPTLDLPSEQVDRTPQLKHLFCLWRPCHPWQVAKAICQIYFGYFWALPPPF